MTKILNATIRKSASMPAAKPDKQQLTPETAPAEPAVSEPIIIGTTDGATAGGTTDAATTACTAAAELIPASSAAAPAPATPSTAKPPSKARQLAALVVRDEGATLDQMIAATGWLPHTTRAALTGLKKKGYVISSDKLDGVRTYRGIAPE